MESGEWRAIRAVQLMLVESGEWSGEWGVESGEWRVESGEWRMGSEEWRMESNRIVTFCKNKGNIGT